MDGYALAKDFVGPFVTVIASVAAVLVTYRLGKSQQRIAADQVNIARHLGESQQRIAADQVNIAKQQADLATVRLKHDLFDRRYEVYEVVFAFFAEVLQSGTMSDQGMSNFVRGIRKAPFLFDQEMIDYFEEIRIQAVRLQGVVTSLNDQRITQEERAQRADLGEQLFTRFLEEFGTLVRRFKSSLALDENTANRVPRPT